MNKILSISACMLMFAGCSAPDPTITQSTAGPSESAEEVAARPVDCPEPVRYNLFPEGIEPALAYHLRSDRLSTAKDGRLRRKVTIEFLEGDSDTALLALDTAIKAGGYKAMPRETGPDGRTSTGFTKAGFGKAIMRTVPDPGNKPSHPKAKGTLSIDYPVVAAAETTAG